MNLHLKPPAGWRTASSQFVGEVGHEDISEKISLRPCSVRCWIYRGIPYPWIAPLRELYPAAFSRHLGPLAAGWKEF